MIVKVNTEAPELNNNKSRMFQYLDPIKLFMC